MQTGDMRDFKHYIFTQTTLGIGESVHGLGERFGAFNKVGQSISLWNADGGTSSDQAYKNVSFWLSSRGYGVFIDTAGKVELEIGSERCSRVQTSVEGQRLKWYLIYGPTPKDVLRRYSVLTGKPGKVPSWSFGLWLSTSFTTNYDEATVNSFLEGMKERDTQVDVFHYDCFWMKVRCRSARKPLSLSLCLSLQLNLHNPACYYSRPSHGRISSSTRSASPTPRRRSPG